MMSSKESDMDGEKEVLKVHSLPWRAVSVSSMFHALDKEADRPAPEITCSWALMK